MSKLVILPPPNLPMPADRVIIVDELVIEGYQLQPAYEFRVSPDNRKWFELDALEGLAASVKSAGILQPILVRPVTPTPEFPQRFEIVAGERRYRAAVMADLAEIPVMVRWLSDAQAAELRLLENVQREDPHPLEEADGYQQLMQAYGYDVKKLMDITKKSKAYIYASLKLCALSLKAREVFMTDEDALPASTALLIARIPVPALQNRALDEILKPKAGGVPMSFREAKSWIQERYMLNLVKAVFPIKDAKLLPGAGNCSSCAKRTGNQPEVFQGISADLCTDPDCFAEKESAHRIVEQQRQASTEAKARKAGIPIYEGEAARPFYNQIYLAGFDVVVDGTPLYTFARANPRTKMAGNVATYLRAVDLPAPIGYVKESKGLMALYDRAAVQQALEAAGACLTEAESAAAIVATNGHVTQEAAAAGHVATAEESTALPQATPTKEDRNAATKRRTDLYIEIRSRAAKQGMTLQLFREIVKLLIKDEAYGCKLPDDLIGHLYDAEDFDGHFGDTSVCRYIDHASLPAVQLLLMDIVISEQLSASDACGEFADEVLQDMNEAMPSATLEEAPARKTLTLTRKPSSTPEQDAEGPVVSKKKIRSVEMPSVSAAHWPFPTNNSDGAK
jgi:ParB/RepB/Spo0J family partition protein